jgi:CBS domain-containing protein
MMEERQSSDLRVEDAFTAAQYRVYPETPLTEIVDLMVRRGLHALPVVGEQYEVLGMITTGDALDRVLREGPGEDDEGHEERKKKLTARDVMTRAVLCVSETQPLLDAARTMVNRNVGQLPVVRDGELIGLITRDAVLSALHGNRDNQDEREED